MEVSAAPRQSCDFCYRRKIKCGRQKPRCSHCVTYGMDCTYAAPRRPSRSTKQRAAAAAAKVEGGMANLQSRVRQLEAQVEEFTKHTRLSEDQHEVSITLPAFMTNGHESAGRDSASDSSLDLPPLRQVLPLVQTFLDRFNAVLPLFHGDTLLQTVHDTYNLDPRRRDPVAWAAINVVLALTYREGLAGSASARHSEEYLGRAQSVLQEVVLGEHVQLLNVQVLVGLSMLAQGSQNLQPALILMATTMRLAHRLGLHNRSSSAHLDVVTARQRSRVFWMAYILDKHLSLYTKQPSIQSDDDIDLDLPGGEEGTDESGIVVAAGSGVKMNYFVTRIQLAVIEGGTYDYLFSTRAQKRSPEERSHALESVVDALEQWKSSVPPDFSNVDALKSASPDTLRFCCALHATSLMCTAAINRAHAWNSQWMISLRRYGTDGTIPRLPPRWEALVYEARDLLVLVSHLQLMNRWSFWLSGCAYMTALVLLTANSIHQPQHDNFLFDKSLVDGGLQVVDTVLGETKNEALKIFRGMCADLHLHAEERRAQAIKMNKSVEFFSRLPELE